MGVQTVKYGTRIPKWYDSNLKRLDRAKTKLITKLGPLN